MIKAILVFNMRGQARALKFFESCPVDAQQKLLREAYQIVSKRDITSCNFVEFNDYKFVYRHYATLYFVFAVDTSENDYDIYELIHMFVQCLDRRFENVCELDLIFHTDKVQHLLNELFMGGFVLDRDSDSILRAIDDQTRVEKQDAGAIAGVGSRIKTVVDTKTEKLKMDFERKFDVRL